MRVMTHARPATRCSCGRSRRMVQQHIAALRHELKGRRCACFDNGKHLAAVRLCGSACAAAL